MMNSVFDNSDSAAKSIVALNAGAAIYASGISSSINDGVIRALDLIKSGEAKNKYEMLIKYSQSL